MEVISTIDIPRQGGEDFQYTVPLEHMVARKEPRKGGNSQLRHQATGSDRIAPFHHAMTITPREMQIIHGIIHYLDSKSTLALGLPANQKYLKEEGKKIDHVHPLCFMWAILSHPEMKTKLRHFRDNSAFALKWDGFLGYSVFHDKGFGRNMEKYYNHRDFNEYRDEFAAFYRALRLRPEVMHDSAASKNWRHFASLLLDDSSYY